MTRNERAWLNRRLKPHGLRLCAMCDEPCALDEFVPSKHNGTYCRRCRRILERVRKACDPARAEQQHPKSHQQRKAEHFERVLAGLKPSKES